VKSFLNVFAAGGRDIYFPSSFRGVWHEGMKGGGGSQLKISNAGTVGSFSDLTVPTVKYRGLVKRNHRVLIIIITRSGPNREILYRSFWKSYTVYA